MEGLVEEEDTKDENGDVKEEAVRREANLVENEDENDKNSSMIKHEANQFKANYVENEEENDENSSMNKEEAAQLKANLVENDDASEEGDDDDEVPHSWNRLPDLALLRVFHFLPIPDKVRLELVCKRWLRLSRDSWVTLTRFSSYESVYAKKDDKLPWEEEKEEAATEEEKEKAATAFFTLLQRMRHPRTSLTSLTSLEIDNRIFWLAGFMDVNWSRYNEEKPTMLGFHTIACLCPYVRTFSVTSPRVTFPRDPDPEAFPEFLHDGATDEGDSNQDDGAFDEELSTTSAWGLKDKHVGQMLHPLPVLERLTIRNSPYVGGLFLKFLPSVIRLKSLCLSNMANNYARTGRATYAHEVIDAIRASSSTESLEELVLESCKGLCTELALSNLSLLIGKKKLRKLSLKANTFNFIFGYEHMFFGGDNSLVELNMSQISSFDNDTLVGMLQWLPQLEILYVMHNKCVTNKSLNKWFKSVEEYGATPPVMVGRRLKFKPLMLYCYGTQIESQPAHEEKEFTWTLSFDQEILGVDDYM